MSQSTPTSGIDAGTARSYALIGFIFYVLGAAGWIIGMSAMLFTTPFWWGQMPSGMVAFPFIPMGIFGVISIGFTAWSWTTLRNIEGGRYSDARTSSLVLGIFGLFFAWLIGGIFFILAYAKLGEILQPQIPITPQRFCVSCGRAVPADAKFCSNCGKEVPP